MSSKQAVDAARAGTVFVLPPEDERFVLVNDPSSPLYDERLELPVSEELALSLAREGQIQPAKVRKNGPNLEILDGRQRFRATRLANEWIADGDARVAFRAGQRLGFKFEVVRPEDEQAAVRQILAANLRVDETPMVRARRIARALKWGLSEEDVRVSYGFQSATTVKNILALLDCAPAVQTAVERRELPESVARRFVGLDRAQQQQLLGEMREKGVMRGSLAGRAVTAMKNGKAVTGDHPGKRMLRRELVERYLALLDKEDGVAAVIANLRFILGDENALAGSDLTCFRIAAARARVQ